MQKIAPLAVDYSTNELLFQPIYLDEFGKELLEGAEKNKDEVNKSADDVVDGATYLVQSRAAPPDDPIKSGWTFLVNEHDPKVTQIIEKMSPLAELRQMKTDGPLLFGGEPENHWRNWLDDNYRTLHINNDDKPPRYVLIVCSENQVPFKFQTLLAAREQAFVGRIEFDKIERLETYIEKVKRIEEGRIPSSDEVAFFATNHGVTQNGCYDGTHYSHFYMEKPLAYDAGQLDDVVVTELVGRDATKTKLMKLLKESKPSLVYTATQAMSAPTQMEIQKKVTGGIICDGQRKKETINDWLITADDIPSDRPIVEGGIFFQYSSFSYGSPTTSDLVPWLSPQRNVPTKLSEVPFIAEIPKKLLFNPHGPLAFVGHLDIVLLHSFTDINDPIPVEDRNNRLEPFAFAVKNILECKPIGYALGGMSGRFSSLSVDISNLYSSLRTTRPQDPERLMHDLCDTFLRRNEAGNYMIFGDPAVRLIPKNTT